VNNLENVTKKLEINKENLEKLLTKKKNIEDQIEKLQNKISNQGFVLRNLRRKQEKDSTTEEKQL
jgi:hypothetical protein